MIKVRKHNDTKIELTKDNKIVVKWIDRDPMKSITLTVLNFFDDLGQIIIECKKHNKSIGYDIIFPDYVDKMKELYKFTQLSYSSFNCGTSANIANTLWNSNIGVHPRSSMTYRHYIDSICTEYENMKTAGKSITNKKISED